MGNITIKKGLGFYFGSVGAVLAVVAAVGCFLVEGLTLEIALLVAGIVLFAATAVTGNNLLIFLPYFCYLGAGCVFLSNQLYTITNVIAGIDATSFETNFLVAAAGLILTILVGLVSTIPSQKK